MAFLSAAYHLLSLSPIVSVKRTPRSLPPRNPNPKPLYAIGGPVRVLGSRFIPWPSRASLHSSSSSSSSSSAYIADVVSSSSEAPSTLRQLCEGRVPDHILQRVEEVGFVVPTDIQRQALPALLSGNDCILHAQTGSGKTLAYLLSIFAAVSVHRSAVQALIVVPTRELGIQVTKVARMLAASPTEVDSDQKSFTVMALLDGGLLKRHKSWLKAEPPTLVVATIKSLCQMLEKKIFKPEAMKVLVIDEVDFIFNSPKQTSSLRKLLTSYSSSNKRQTVFASASIPQHRHFLYDCIQQKWTKRDVVHIHVNSVKPMPSQIHHRFVLCNKEARRNTLLSLLQYDRPESGIIFVGEQSEKSKQAGDVPSTALLLNFLKTSYVECPDVHLLEEEMNFNQRAASLSEVRQGGGFLLVATDIVARGVDLPETSHIYNFDLPGTVVDYLHRAGRTGRKPFSDEKCTVTNIITSQERFVLKRFENELLFECEEVCL